MNGKKKKITYPYENSKLTPAQSREKIAELLEKYGCRDLSWTMIDKRYNLKFALEIEIAQNKRLLGFIFIPPQIPKEVKQYNEKLYRYDKVIINDEVVSFRVLYWYLKNKIIAVQTGLISAEQEFMANILIRLPDGREGTLLDKLKEELPRLTNIQQFSALPSPSQKRDDERTTLTTSEYRTEERPQ
jgi:hypothetical protein